MHKIWGESVPNLRGEFWRNKQKTQNVVIMYLGQTQNIVPSVDKGKHACQCAFAAIYIAEGIRWKRQGRKWGERVENVLTSGEFVIK